MPELEITPEMIGPQRTRLALSYIESVMLWPHDAEKRSEAMKTGTATFIRDAISAVPAARRAVDAAEWLDYFGLLADAMPLRLVQQEAKQPYVYGIIAGELLGAAVGDYSIDGTLKLTALKSEIVSICKKRAESISEFSFSISTLDNTIWRRYKPVSHLWAAHVSMALSGDHTFPCSLSRLPYFLGLAKYFLEQGLSIQPPRRGENLLEERVMWHLPPGLHIPTLEVEFGERRYLNRSKKT